MGGQQLIKPPAGAGFSWHGALWTVIVAAAAGGIYCLYQHRIMTEEQLMLLIFVTVPVAAFLLSGHGQVQSDHIDDPSNSEGRRNER